MTGFSFHSRTVGSNPAFLAHPELPRQSTNAGLNFASQAHFYMSGISSSGFLQCCCFLAANEMVKDPLRFKGHGPVTVTFLDQNLLPFVNRVKQFFVQRF